MKFKKIQIKNFRSIKELEIDFLENPRVLVGINESGKTNILHALRILDRSFSILNSDIREPSKAGEKIEEHFVLFIFELEAHEIEELYKKIKSEILMKDDSINLVIIDDKKYNLLELLKIKNEVLYKVNLKDRNITFPNFENSILFQGFKKPKSGTNFTFKDGNGNEINISQFKLIDYDSYKNYIPPENLEDATIEDLKHLIENKITELSSKNLPKVIFWEYKDEYLLPPSISIDTFQTAPNSCIPLKNIFGIANIPENDIYNYINEVKNDFNRFRSRLNKIAKAATEFFRKAWPEYKTIKFTLIPSETYIKCGVEEKNIWDFQKRSDGFKRFISLLISLAMPVKQGLLNNALILIDNADTDLHPSGCKYLMEQLKKIAKTNYVIYATHSIFMIDTGNIKRHYIVRKTNEITKIEEATEETYKDEEVLYKALGASVYEILNEKNILFEGWTDKKLFEVAITKNKNYGRFFQNIGISHAIGATSIKNVLPILEMGNRKCLVISDADDVSLRNKKEWKKEKGWGKWKTYKEILPNREFVSCEDFIKKEVLNQKLQEVLQSLNVEIDISKFNFPDFNRVVKLRNFLKEKGVKEEKINEIMKKLKELTFKDLKFNEIDKNYFEFIENIKKELEKL